MSLLDLMKAVRLGDLIGEKRLLELQKILRCCPHIRDLSLVLGHPQVTKQELFDLCKTIDLLHSLKYLRFGFVYCETSLEGIAELCKSRESLEEVTLRIIRKKTIKEEVKKFMHSVGSIPRQMKFEFEFPKSEMTEEDLAELRSLSEIIPNKKFLFSSNKSSRKLF